MSEQVRADFEKWANRHHGVLQLGKVEGYYSNMKVTEDWHTWQASRKSLVVKLPEYAPNDHRLNTLIDEFKTQLDAVGVRYE